MAFSSLETVMSFCMPTMMEKQTDTSSTTGLEMTVAKMRQEQLLLGKSVIFNMFLYLSLKELLSLMKGLVGNLSKLELLRVRNPHIF